MEKIVIPSSWPFGEAICQMVKYSSRGLVGADYSVLVKRAGEEAAHWLRNIKVAEDQIPLHVIAMGATEGYGPNRNGDGFKEAALRQYCDTFVKHAKHYRHHKNKDPEIRYGSVKAAWYNETMKRVELLSVLNATKEAAEKYGGFVADKELDMINSGKDIPVSMACKVAYDVCSGCGNKARHRGEYCTEETCKYGGCKDNLTKVAADGHILHVDNPHPTFFDISTVIRPADRIAYGNVADYLQKAASCDLVGGAALAEAYGLTVPLDVVLSSVADKNVARQIKLAYALAAVEDNIDFSQSNVHRDIARAFGNAVQPPMDLTPLGNVGTTKFATGLAALASQKIAMPIRDFLRLVLGEDSVKYAEFSEVVPDLLPGVYNRLITSGNLEQSVRSNPYTPSRDLAPVTQREWANKQASNYSLDPQHVGRRASLSAIRLIVAPSLLQQDMSKVASASGEAEQLARAYALYKLAFLSQQNDDFVNVPLTGEMLVLQNYTN